MLHDTTVNDKYCCMKNKDEQNKKEWQQPSTAQMEKDQPIVNEEEQVFPVNPQDNMPRDGSGGDFNSEHDMNQRSQEEDSETTKMKHEKKTEDIEADSEDTEGVNKIPTMNT